MQKSKTAAKGAGKLRPGTEQVRSGTQMQRDEQVENVEAPRSGQQQKTKHEQGKNVKKH